MLLKAASYSLHDSALGRIVFIIIKVVDCYFKTTKVCMKKQALLLCRAVSFDCYSRVTHSEYSIKLCDCSIGK